MCAVEPVWCPDLACLLWALRLVEMRQANTLACILHHKAGTFSARRMLEANLSKTSSALWQVLVARMQAKASVDFI